MSDSGHTRVAEWLRRKSRPTGSAPFRSAKRAVLELENLTYGAMAFAGSVVPRHRPSVQIDLAALTSATPPGKIFAVVRAGQQIGMASRLEELRYQDDPLGCDVEENAVYVPAGELGSERGGGMYRPDGELIRSSALFREVGLAQQVTVERTHAPGHPAVCDDAVVYIGSLLSHFGHLLTESMARLWYALDERPDLPILCHGEGAMQFPHVRRAVSALGVADRVLTIRRPTRFREVHLPEPSYVLRSAIHPRHLDVTRRITRATFPDGVKTAAKTQQPLYLSRARLPIELRSTHGERTLVRRLRREGVKVIDPQTLDLAEQIELVNRHETIIGPIGSAHCSALLTLEPCDRVYVCPGVKRSFFLMDLATGDRSHYLQGVKRVATVQRKANPLIDVAFTLSAMRDIGVLSSG